MKKQYIVPQTTTIMVSVPQMICESLEYKGAASTNGVITAETRRHYSVWDDDEDNEEW